MDRSISNLLTNLLSRFVDIGDRKDFGEGLTFKLMNGSLRLENVKLKKDLFNSLDIPFELLYGVIGVLEIKVPVLSIFSERCSIVIENLFILFGPKEILDSNNERSPFRKANRSSHNHNSNETSNSIFQKYLSYFLVDNMLRTILTSFTIDIFSIHIRYEDINSSNHNHHFCSGITIESFKLNPCLPQKPSDIQLWINIQTLSIYMNPIHLSSINHNLHPIKDKEDSQKFLSMDRMIPKKVSNVSISSFPHFYLLEPTDSIDLDMTLDISSTKCKVRRISQSFLFKKYIYMDLLCDIHMYMYTYSLSL